MNVTRITTYLKVLLIVSMRRHDRLPRELSSVHDKERKRRIFEAFLAEHQDWQMLWGDGVTALKLASLYPTDADVEEIASLAKLTKQWEAQVSEAWASCERVLCVAAWS